MTPSPDLHTRLAAAAREVPELEWLVLHGSRSRGGSREGSDWDFAFRATGSLDVAALGNRLAAVVNGDVDLANVERAGAVLQFNVAREGVVLFERRPGAFDDFRERVSQFWCEAGAVIGEAQAAMLAKLGRTP